MLNIVRADQRIITLTRLLPFVLIWLLIPLITHSASLPSSKSSDPYHPLEIFDSMPGLPLAFVPQERFLDTPAGFSVRSSAGTLFFTQAGMILSLPYYPARTNQSPLLVETLRIQFEGANPYLTIEGIDPLAGSLNDFTGNDPTQWQTNLPTFAGIAYVDLHPGINLYYEGQQGWLKGTYFIAPGADPSRIAWRYAGADEVEIDPLTGDLLVTLILTATGDTYHLREQAPNVWQEIHGKRVPVEAGYVITGERITFSLGAYNPAYALIVDRSYAGQ
ncbi:MAG: hypothetical protein H6631_07345 [Anaerolineaceae bacterium]|nr:hypothetical protein [Anaerolineaceae bacterium]MCB9097953.1 hypothetical protein [Anaerolineales bacterium]